MGLRLGLRAYRVDVADDETRTSGNLVRLVRYVSLIIPAPIKPTPTGPVRPWVWT